MRKHITQLKSENSNVIKDQNELPQEQTKIYQELYTSNKVESHQMNKYLDDTIFDLVLNDDQKAKYEVLLSEVKYKKALGALKNNKSPGIDGITVEFYRVFWEGSKT